MASGMEGVIVLSDGASRGVDLSVRILGARSVNANFSEIGFSKRFDSKSITLRAFQRWQCHETTDFTESTDDEGLGENAALLSGWRQAPKAHGVESGRLET